MSKNSNSKLPYELNENWGSNYMMDGFRYDMEYGHGLKDNPPANPIPQPSTSGMAHLPGVLLGSSREAPLECSVQPETGLDLGDVGLVAEDVEKYDKEITDYSWLEDAYQDLDRLPKLPSDDTLRELQNLWGDRTDGIIRIDLKEREIAQEQANLKWDATGETDPIPNIKLAAVVQSAMRKSAMGVPFNQIRGDVLSLVPEHEDRRILQALDRIESEHGLVGNVYIRMSAYPNMLQGKWAKPLKKALMKCSYLVGDKNRESSSCATALGLRIIKSPKEINWKKECGQRARLLQASKSPPRNLNRQNYRELLRGWYLSKDQKPKKPEAKFFYSASASLCERSSNTAASTPEANAPIRSKSSILHEKGRGRVASFLLGLYDKNAITKKQATDLFRMGASEEVTVRKARALSEVNSRRRYASSTFQDSRVSQWSTPRLNQPVSSRDVTAAITFARKKLQEGVCPDGLRKLLFSRVPAPVLKKASLRLASGSKPSSDSKTLAIAFKKSADMADLPPRSAPRSLKTASIHIATEAESVMDYGLGSNSLDHIEYSEDHTHDPIGTVTFGGFEL